MAAKSSKKPTENVLPALSVDAAVVPALLSFFEAHKRDLPWRRTRDPYAVWVSEIMLQQTRVEAVIPYYERFMQVLPNVTALAACPDDQLFKLWEGLGYYSRVKNMRRAAQVMVQNGMTTLPQTHVALLSLPGIGQYTAGAIASIAWGLPVPAVDGNVLRVTARLCDCYCNILDPAFKTAAEAAWAPLIPTDGSAGLFTQSLFELGATVCLPRTPKCEECPVRDKCRAYAAGHTTELPVRISKTQKTICEKTVWLLTNRDNSRVVICARPDTGLLAGLYEFPNCEGTCGESAFHALFPGVTSESVTALPPAKHVFTHLIWQMIGYRVVLSDAVLDTFATIPNGTNPFVADVRDLRDKYSIPSAFGAYKKILIPNIDKKKGKVK